MAWTTPKTDWSATTKINATAMNRITNNLKWLKDHQPAGKGADLEVTHLSKIIGGVFHYCDYITVTHKIHTLEIDGGRGSARPEYCGVIVTSGWTPEVGDMIYIMGEDKVDTLNTLEFVSIQDVGSLLPAGGIKIRNHNLVDTGHVYTRIEKGIIGMFLFYDNYWNWMGRSFDA